MRLEYTSLVARRQNLPSGWGLGDVGQLGPVRRVANLDQVRCWEHKRVALFFPALMSRAGSSSAMNRYPNEPSICLAMRQS